MKRRGQVLVLGAGLAIFVCVAVLATFAIGNAVRERVKLQHTADATAYSLATAEARAFNLYARVNRAHASNYVSAMTAQSLLSFLFFTEAFLTDVTGLAHSFPCLAPEGPWVAICAAARRAPAVGSVLTLLGNVATVVTEVTRGYQRALNGGDPGMGPADDTIDRTVGLDLVPSFLERNGALTAVAQSVMEATEATVRSGGGAIVSENDPDLPPEAIAVELSTASACLFARAHQEAAFGRPGALVDPYRPLAPRAREDRDVVARAKRAMAGVANATRQACGPGAGFDCPPNFLTARRAGIGWSLPPVLGALTPWLSRIPKWGQTRLLSYGMGGADGQNYLREPDGAPDIPSGMLAQGDNLGADDLYQLPLGPFGCKPSDAPARCWGDPRFGHPPPGHPPDSERPFRAMTKTSIWALNSEERPARPFGVHWRVAYPDHPRGAGHVPPQDLGHDHPELQRLGLHEARRRLLGLIPVSVYVANVRPIQDGHHPWPGVAPFPNFEPGQFEGDCATGEAGTSDDRPALRRDDFNQPSVWVALEKRPGFSAPPTIHLESDTERLDTGLGRAGSSHAAGLHAFARAQAYYHRPGDWAEHPNFFNPYWRARLAATLQGQGPPPAVRRGFEALPDLLRRTPERVVTH